MMRNVDHWEKLMQKWNFKMKFQYDSPPSNFIFKEGRDQTIGLLEASCDAKARTCRLSRRPWTWYVCRDYACRTASTELKDFDKVHVAGLPLQAPMNYEQCGLRWRKCVRQQLFKNWGPTRAELLQLILIESFLSIIVPIFAVSFQD